MDSKVKTNEKLIFFAFASLSHSQLNSFFIIELHLRKKLLLFFKG